MPIADIKTTSDVLPAEINGKGMPVGGETPVMNCYCTERKSSFITNIPL